MLKNHQAPLACHNIDNAFCDGAEVEINVRSSIWPTSLFDGFKRTYVYMDCGALECVVWLVRRTASKDASAQYRPQMEYLCSMAAPSLQTRRSRVLSLVDSIWLYDEASLYSDHQQRTHCKCVVCVTISDWSSLVAIIAHRQRRMSTWLTLRWSCLMRMKKKKTDIKTNTNSNIA